MQVSEVAAAPVSQSGVKWHISPAGIPEFRKKIESGV